MGMTIGKLIVQRDNFKVDETYQRPPDAWSNKDKQCFIDTILRNEPVPLFFINEKDEDGKKVNYIVDGQQRINCILDFYDGKIALSKVFSAPELDGKKYKDLPSSPRQVFGLFPGIQNDVQLRRRKGAYDFFKITTRKSVENRRKTECKTRENR